MQNHTSSSAAGFVLLCALLGSCTKDAPDMPEAIDPENLKLVNAKPLLELNFEADTSRTNPSETMALQFLKILEKKNLQENVKECAAREGFHEAGGVSEKCGDENGESEPNAECLIDEGYWKGHLGKQLEMKSFDLNQDHVPDYIVTGVMCTGMVGNGGANYHVFLSQQDKRYSLAASISAQSLAVLPKANGGYWLLENTVTINGESVGMWSLNGNEYTQVACFYKDLVFEKDPVFRKCRK